MSSIQVDALYEAFCSALPVDVRETARALAHRLALAPNSHVPWSAVFKHEVTLAAPTFFLEDMKGVTPGAAKRAALAHMLSVIEAFGTDRLADGQVEDAADLRRVLELMRAGRDDALGTVGGQAFRGVARRADERTKVAIARERALFTEGPGVSLDTYVEVSAGKQAVGLPASVALAHLADWPEEKIELVQSTLMGVWLGLQFQDDVVDWEDDAARGGAWAVLLGRHAAHQSPPHDPVALRRWVESSGAPAAMLALAAERFEEASGGARSLGAMRLSSWASARAAEAREQWAGERRNPGYMRRLRALGAFKAEVVG